MNALNPEIVASAEKAAALMASSELVGYKYVSRCAVCSAMSQVTGKNIRPEIDAAVLNAQRARAGLDILKLHGVTGISLRQLQAHIQMHSPFVRLGVDSKKMLEKVNKVAAEHINAQDAAQYIVNRGIAMIKDGTMPITERLFSTALREANKNQQVTKFEEIARELDRKLFNRRTIKPEVEKKLNAELIEGETVES